MRIYFIDRPSCRLYRISSLGRLKPERHLHKICIGTISPSLLDLLQDIVCQPRKQASIFLSQRIKNAINTLCHERIPVQLYLIGGKLADLAGECLERLLKESVYRTYCERTIIVQNIMQD